MAITLLVALRKKMANSLREPDAYTFSCSAMHFEIASMLTGFAKKGKPPN